MKTTQEIKTEFLQVLNEVFMGVKGITLDLAITATTQIIQESGKYTRQEVAIKSGNSAVNNSEPATDKQKYALEKNGVEFSEDITKTEASALLDKVMPKRNSNTKGGFFPARSFK